MKPKSFTEEKEKNYSNKDIKNDKKSLLKDVKSIEIKDKSGLVFFGTCHCSGGTTGS